MDSISELKVKIKKKSYRILNNKKILYVTGGLGGE